MPLVLCRRHHPLGYVSAQIKSRQANRPRECAQTQMCGGSQQAVSVVLGFRQRRSSLVAARHRTVIAPRMRFKSDRAVLFPRPRTMPLCLRRMFTFVWSVATPPYNRCILKTKWLARKFSNGTHSAGAYIVPPIEYQHHALKHDRAYHAASQEATSVQTCKKYFFSSDALRVLYCKAQINKASTCLFVYNNTFNS